MSDLVGNPEDRFSRVAAHIILMIEVQKQKSEFTIKRNIIKFIVKAQIKTLNMNHDTDSPCMNVTG